jgi:apolipoprotein N-acyltransferase
MCRAANTGVTAIIDHRGIVTARLADPETGSTFLEGVLPGKIAVPRAGEMTLYARVGDAFAILMAITCLGSYLATFRAKRQLHAPGPGAKDAANTSPPPP